MMDEERIETIDRYLSNQMTVIDRSGFEERLAKDPVLLQDMLKVKRANYLILISRLQNDADSINSWHPPKKSWHRYLIPGFGVFVIVTLLTGLVYFFNSPNTKQVKPSYNQDETEAAVGVFEVASHSNIQDSGQGDIIHENETVILKGELNPIDSSATPKDDTNKIDNPTVKFSELKSDNTIVESNTLVQNRRSSGVAQIDSDSSFYSISVFNCNTANFILDIKVENTCIGKNNGKVLVDEVSGGNSPYTFSLDSMKFSQTSSFGDLPLGQYVLYLKDSNGCSFRKPFDILEKDCRENDFTFSPESGQKFMFPLYEGESGYIKITSVSGEIIFQSAIEYGGSWEGISLKGKVAPLDTYPYIIRLNNGKIIEGSVSISSP